MSSGDAGSGDGREWRTPQRRELGGDECNIVERTVLNSPVAEVIETTRVGDVFQLALEAEPRTRVVAKTPDGQTAGAITSPSLADIIECIQSGNSFEAEVTAVAGGRVEIEVRPA